MISDRLIALVRCPECRGTHRSQPRHGSDGLTCQSCGRAYRAPGGEYLDLRPADQFAEQTKYLDEALHADARHERVSPPLLGSKIRNDMLRAVPCGPRPGDLVVDLGCGSGRALVWNRDLGAETIGIDISPFFSRGRAARRAPCSSAICRRLPFADGTFTKAWSLDVLEHLSPEALRGMLAEGRRVLAPGGALFVYTHVRKNAPVAVGLRWINKLARGLERARPHRHAPGTAAQVRSPQPARRRARSRARRARRAASASRASRFYTPIVGGFVENILMRMAERAMARRAARRLDPGRPRRPTWTRGPSARREPPAKAADRHEARRPTASLRALSFAMKLDLLLFGRITSGPFFALLVKRANDERADEDSSYCAHRLRRIPGTTRAGRRARHGGGGRTRRARARRPRARDAGRRAVSIGSRQSRALDRDGAAVRRESSCGGCARARSGASSRALRPDVVMERYYNFGGEGVLAAAAAGANAVLEVNAPVIDHRARPRPASIARSSSSRCVDGASASAATPT